MSFDELRKMKQVIDDGKQAFNEALQRVIAATNHIGYQERCLTYFVSITKSDLITNGKAIVSTREHVQRDGHTYAVFLHNIVDADDLRLISWSFARFSDTLIARAIESVRLDENFPFEFEIIRSSSSLVIRVKQNTE